jgi:hypothetical protein
MTTMPATPTPRKLLFFLFALAVPATIANAQLPPIDTFAQTVGYPRA